MFNLLASRVYRINFNPTCNFEFLATESRRFILCLLFVACSVSLAAAQQIPPPVAPQDDTQNWNDVQLTITINNRFDFLINGQTRVGNELRDFADARAGIGVALKAGKYLTFTPGYQSILMRQPVTARRTIENRFSFAAIVRFPSLEKLTITDRNLVERRLFNNRPNTTRYRNRLQVERPFHIGNVGVRLFVSDEVFYDSGTKAWSRNRFTIGGMNSINTLPANSIICGNRTGAAAPVIYTSSARFSGSDSDTRNIYEALI